MSNNIEVENIHIEIWSMTKEEREAVRKSDAYGFKKMFSDVIKHYTCPKCRDGKGGLGFFVWEDEAKGLAVCSSCGFKKQFALNESHESTVDEIKRYRSEYAEQGNEEVTN